MSDHHSPHAVSRPFWTPGTRVLALLAALGLAVYLTRFIVGLDDVTHLDDTHPWGLWIALDVASGVALAAGGFTAAALAHVFHRRAFHAIARPALLTAALGYTFVVIGLCVDLGRPYNVWHPIVPWMANADSVLFEVGICVMIYLTVLYIELIPVAVEWVQRQARWPRLSSAATRLGPWVERAMWPFVIAGVVLSCGHQSSLGGLMVIAPTKLHPLWWSPILPLLFLLSAVAVGPAMVIVESTLASRSLRLRPESRVMQGLGRIVPVLLGVYLLAKVMDLLLRDAWVHLFEGSLQSWAWWAEVLLGILLPMGLTLAHRTRRSPRWLFAAALLAVLGVVLNRLNVFMVGFLPATDPTPYVPALTEVVLTVGLVSLLVLIYRAAVIHLPILSQELEPDPVLADTGYSPGERHILGLGKLLLLGLGLGLGLATQALAEEPDEVILLDMLSEPDDLAREVDQFGPVPFSHAAHARWAELSGGCALCHHYTPVGAAHPECRSCHSTDIGHDHAIPGLKGAYHRQCLGCHRGWSHTDRCGVCHLPRESSQDTDEVPSDTVSTAQCPDSCAWECSFPSNGAQVIFQHDSHTREHGLRCAACHRGDGCVRCHDTLSPGGKASSVSHASCQGCHDTSTGCQSCHRAAASR